MANVSVQVKGSPTGTQTNEEGRYTISAPANGTLTFSYVGFTQQEVKVNNRTSIDVTLVQLPMEMNEVVVVGYGTQKRSDVTGAISSVPKNRFTQLPVTNLMQAIQGAVAGVGVAQTSSVPGSTANVQIRGINSITANNSPLIVVDGIPLSQDASTNDINANDVASMEILKDPSAVAIYGVRGSNGVILITTKRGTSGKPVIRYSGYTGLDNLAHILTPSSPEQYVEKYTDYLKQNSLTQTSAGRTHEFISLLLF